MSVRAERTPAGDSWREPANASPDFCNEDGCLEFAQSSNPACPDTLKFKCPKHEAAARARGETGERTPVPNFFPTRADRDAADDLNRKPPTPYEKPETTEPSKKENEMPGRKPKQVEILSAEGAVLGQFASATDLAQAIGVAKSSVSAFVSKGIAWRGFKFRLAAIDTDRLGWVGDPPEIPAGRAKPQPRDKPQTNTLPAKRKYAKRAKPTAKATVEVDARELAPRPSSSPPLLLPATTTSRALTLADVLSGLASLGGGAITVEDVAITVRTAEAETSIAIKRIAFGGLHADN